MDGFLRVWLILIALAFSGITANATILSDDFKLEKLEHGRKASANADYRRGHKAFKRGKVLKAIEWFRKAADAGDVKAQTNLGILYLTGPDRIQGRSDEIIHQDAEIAPHKAAHRVAWIAECLGIEGVHKGLTILFGWRLGIVDKQIC